MSFPWRERMRERARPLVDWLARVSESWAGTVLEFALPAPVVIIPALQGFGVIESPLWLLIFVPMWAVDALFTRLRRGSVSRLYAERVEQINGAFAGALESFIVRLQSTKRRGLTDEQSHELCVALLARIREFAQLSLGLGDECQVRATLAVPTTVVRDGLRVDVLRVWCYDRPVGNAYTVLELGQGEPGAATSFATGRLSIIRDTHTVASIPDAASRPYRSVLSFPVPTGRRHGAGQPLAVVNIDVSKAEVFTPEIAVNRVLPYIAPAVNQIGLVLIARRRGTDYGFSR